MSIQKIRTDLHGFSKDINLNLSRILTPMGSPGLNDSQIFSIALSCAYTTNNKSLVLALLEDGKEHLTDEYIHASKAASTIMAMNNIYYRFVHLVSDQEYQSMPAQLRMSIITNPGVASIDFELMSLAVSALNGCGLCIDSHTLKLEKDGMSKAGIQSSIRIAAIINAADQALKINGISHPDNEKKNAI